MEKKYEDLLNWWLNLDKLSEEETTIINIHNREDPDLENNDDYNELQDIFFKELLLFSNISSLTYKIELQPTASEIIEKLFETYVDDETLVICSRNEHETPAKCSKKCKNVCIIDTENFDINLYINEIKQYKKAFVYIIGTEISAGRITPQIVFDKLKEAFDSLDIKSTIVCDDVHGMFMTPRDYRIFDYVIGTAHTLNKNFNMGFVVSKIDNPEFGFKASNWLGHYIKMLRVILKRRDKMIMFYKVLATVFEKYLIRKEFELIPYVTQNIYSMYMDKIPITKEKWQELEDLFIRIEGFDDDNCPRYMVRIRSQQFITHPDYLFKGMNKLLKILDSAVYCWDNLH